MVSNKHGSNSAVTFKNELSSLHLGFKNIKILYYMSQRYY
jgi:hypothetical protein